MNNHTTWHITADILQVNVFVVTDPIINKTIEGKRNP